MQTQLSEQWQRLCDAHPPGTEECQVIAALDELMAHDANVGRSTTLADAFAQHSSSTKDPFTGLPLAKRTKWQSPQTPAALKSRNGLTTSQYKKLLMGKTLDPPIERPPPFHTQVNAFGMRAPPPPTRPPPSYVQRHTPTSLRHAPSGGVSSTEASTQLLKQHATASQGPMVGSRPPMVRPPNIPSTSKACTLCEEWKPALQHSGGSRYCRSCESLRWECRKRGVRLPALRQALLAGKERIVERAAEIQNASLQNSHWPLTATT